MEIKCYKSVDWIGYVFIVLGSRTQQTRPGSYGINNSHLAGVKATRTDPSDRVVQNFCIKTSYVADGGYEWEEGLYGKNDVKYAV